MSRQRKAAKSELNQIVKSINNRMEDFESAVQELKDLKDSLSEVDDEIVARAAENSAKMEKLNRDFNDNKIRTVNQAVRELGKVIISEEELSELRNQLEKVKSEAQDKINSEVSAHKTALDEKLEQALEVQKLQHERETAQLQAAAHAHKQEVANLKETLTRMSEELASQKKLTADICSANKPVLAPTQPTSQPTSQ